MKLCAVILAAAVSVSAVCGIDGFSASSVPAHQSAFMSRAASSSTAVMSSTSLSSTSRQRLDLRGGGVSMTSQQPTPAELAFDSAYLDGRGERRGYCNWVVPGKVMLGRYPAGTPVGTKTGSPKPEETLEHMRKVINAGVDTFICLQEEVPLQDKDEAWPADGIVPLADPTMRAKYPGGFVRYQADAIKVSKEKSREKGPTFIRLPIIDFGTPEFEPLSNMLGSVASAVQNDGAALYVHCWGGRGRAGTIGACLYMLLGPIAGFTDPVAAADEALEVVQRGYDTRVGADGGGDKSPETEGQREFVRAFARSICKGASVSGG